MMNRMSADKKRILPILLLLIVAMIIPFLYQEYALLLILFFCMSFLLISYLKMKIDDKDELSFVLTLCLVGFSLRMAFIVLSNMIPSIAIVGDDVLYTSKGTEIAETWSRGQGYSLTTSTHFFYELYNGIIFYVFGVFPSLVKIFNSFLGILAAINIYFSVRKISGIFAARISAVLMIFLPSLVLWQSLNLKEALVVFLLTSIIRGLIYIHEKPKLLPFAIILALTYLLVNTRNYVGLYVGVVIFIYFLIVSQYKTHYKLLVFFLAAFALCYLGFKSGFMGNLLTYVRQINLSWIDSAVRRGDYSLTQSAVLQDVKYSTVPELIRFLPLGVTYFLFSPFPWMLDGSLTSFISVFENIIWYFLVIFFILGLFPTYKRNKVIAVLLICILIFFVFLYSATMGNMGLAYRYKDMLMPIFIIFISSGIAGVHQKYIQKVKRNERILCQNS